MLSLLRISKINTKIAAMVPLEPVAGKKKTIKLERRRSTNSASQKVKNVICNVLRVGKKSSAVHVERPIVADFPSPNYRRRQSLGYCDILNEIVSDNLDFQSSEFDLTFTLSLMRACGISKTDFEKTEALISKIRNCDLELDVIEVNEWVPKNMLMFFGLVIFRSYNQFSDVANLDGDKFIAFFEHVETRYHLKPYHNIQHATDVLFNTHCLLSGTDLGSKLSSLQKYTMLLTAILHDVEHLGVTNAFLKKRNHPIYLEYNCDAPLEAMHLDVALTILQHGDFELLYDMTESSLHEIGQLAPRLLAATDLSVQKATLFDFAQAMNENNTAQQQHHLAAMALHAADLCASAKIPKIHHSWALRIQTEFANERTFETRNLSSMKNMQINTFLTSDRNAQLAAMAKDQIWFITNLVQPVFSSLHEHGSINLSQYLHNIEQNLFVWNSYSK